MRKFAVPGVAVGIVRDGKVAFVKGYGVRTVGTDEPVGSNTLFTVGTNTKQFTAAALSLLVDEGKLSWDDRVSDRLPAFRMGDPYVTRELRVRDLLGHRTGLPSGAGNLLIYPETNFNRSEALAAFASLPSGTGFRSRYSYSNLAYVIAGELVPAVTGSSWDDFVQKRLLDRTGMARCSASGGPSDNDDVAQPHVLLDGRQQRVRTVSYGAAAPANGVWCDVDGLTKWIGMLLNEGRAADGGAVLSPKQLREMWSVQIASSVPGTAAELNRTHFRGYGLGWNLEDFEGRLRVFHTGGVMGQVSHVTLFPEHRLGVVVLSNQRSTAPLNAITMHIAKALLGGRQLDWVGHYGDIHAAQRLKAAAFDTELAAALTNAGPPPSPLTTYEGTYRDNWRGEVMAEAGKRGLGISFSRTARLKGRLHFYRDDTFVVRWQERALAEDAFVHFQRGAGGQVVGVKIESLPSSEGDLDFQNLKFDRVSSPEPSSQPRTL